MPEEKTDIHRVSFSLVLLKCPYQKASVLPPCHGHLPPAHIINDIFALLLTTATIPTTPLTTITISTTTLTSLTFSFSPAFPLHMRRSNYSTPQKLLIGKDS